MLMADSTRVPSEQPEEGTLVGDFRHATWVQSLEERQRSQPRTNVAPPPSCHGDAWVRRTTLAMTLA
jgi:hypothetical protein